MDGIDGQLVIRATAAAGLAKTFVDMVRLQTDLPPIAPSVSAFLFSLIILICLYGTSRETVWDSVTGFTVVLGAIIATPLAIGATAVQAAVERRSADNRIVEIIDRADADKARAVEQTTVTAIRTAEATAAATATATAEAVANASKAA